MDLFADFERRMIEAGDTELYCRIGGDGPPLVMLHGYPQTGATWHKVAPAFAEHFRCVVPDLRGYGRSAVPEPDTDHEAYSKRTMARDIVELMGALGFERFHVLGHDRGARVSYRLALDHPERVERLGIIEVIPTGETWARFNAPVAMGTYHWSFLAQPHPLPERLIEGDPGFYLHWTLRSWTGDKTLDAFHPDALGEYRMAFSEPERVRAFCEDYRAGWHVDRKRDAEDMEAGRRIAAPLHFIWSDRGRPEDAAGTPIDVWRDWAETVTGQSIQSGHFAQEENPVAVIDSFLPFFHDGS